MFKCKVVMVNNHILPLRQVTRSALSNILLKVSPNTAHTVTACSIVFSTLITGISQCVCQQLANCRMAVSQLKADYWPTCCLTWLLTQ